MPPPHVVLAAGPDVLMAPGLGEAHLQVAQAFGAGATVGEVLERSPLGHLETQQLIVQLDEAQQLRPTGALRHPEVPSLERRVEALRQAQLEVSQQVVASTLEAVLVDPGLPPPRRSRWVPVLAGCAIAVSGTIGLVLGSADDEATAEPVPVVAEAPAEPAPLVVAGPPPSPCPPHMVYLPAGELSEDPTDRAEADEPGALAVYVGALCIDRHEVTVAQYRACAERGDCSRGHTEADWSLHGRRAPRRKRAEASRRCNAEREGTDEHPMNCVTWEQANAFCHSQGKRLPTEAQWERAARGDGERRYPWGSAPPTSERVNACGPECTREVPAYAESDHFEGTSPVGRSPLGATPDGVHDLGGNVREWTAGAVDELPPGAMPVEHRVVRGGGFASMERTELESGHRQPVAVNERRPDLGFRCVSAPGG
jgi:formylglycine-generating enzyme required for sulfatase activity